MPKQPGGRRDLRSGFRSIGHLTTKHLLALMRKGARAMAEEETPVKMRKGAVARTTFAKAREAAIAADTSHTFLCVGDW